MAKVTIITNVTSDKDEYDNYESLEDGDPKEYQKKTKKFSQIVDESLSEENNFVVPRDLRVDDRDLPQAKNFVEFLCDKRFIGIPTPFAKQLEIGVNLLAEYCPDCSDEDYVENVPVADTVKDFRNRVQLLEWGKCPRCHGNRAEFYRDKKIRVPTELALLAGQRSTKSWTVAMILVYLTHTYFKLQNPSLVFGALQNAKLYCFLTALNWVGAKELMYDPMHDFIADSKWFTEWHSMLDYYGKKYGVQLYKFKDTFYSCRARNIIVTPFGPDRKKMRGRTLYSASVDEMGLFDHTDKDRVKLNAEEVHTSLSNALRTVRSAYYRLLKKGHYNILAPLMCSSSSPLSKKDMMVRLYERSKSNNNMYGVHYATWEMNPLITKADLDSEFQDRPELVMRDFGAVPPHSSLPFISSVDQISPLVENRMPNSFQLRKVVQRISNQDYTCAKLVAKRERDSISRVLAIDAGHVNNSFSLTTGYYDTATERTVLDCMIELMPSPNQPINFASVYDDVILPIIEYANVKMVVSDRWQNLKLLHDIEQHTDAKVEQYSLKYADFATFRHEVIGQTIRIPRPEMSAEKVMVTGDNSYPTGFANAPVAHFVFQLLTVQDHANKAVTKGDGTTDDIVRSAVLAHCYLIDPEYQSMFTGVMENTSTEKRVFGVVGLYSVGPQTTFSSYKNLGVVHMRSNFNPIKTG